MAYNTKAVVTDVEGNPISQYYNKELDQYEPVEGQAGANKVVLYNPDGTENNSLSLTPILDKLAKLTGTVIDEETRKSNELQRIDTEGTRQSNEDIRKANEVNRKNAEDTRVQNEDARIVNEQSRTTNEDGRIANENIRKANETNRKNAELTRNENENIRTSNEDLRITLYNTVLNAYNSGAFKGEKGDTGNGLEFVWNGTSLGVRIKGQVEYIYVDLKGEKGDTGDIANLTSQHVTDALGYTPADETDLANKVDNSRVLTDVPLNAKFTDTTYSEISTAEIDTGTAGTLRTITGRRIGYIISKVSDMISTAISSLTKADIGLSNVDNVKQMPMSGGTFTGIAKSHSNTSYTVAQIRNIILSPNDAVASSMNNGDIWIKYK